jgi:hypothetical protein
LGLSPKQRHSAPFSEPPRFADVFVNQTKVTRIAAPPAGLGGSVLFDQTAIANLEHASRATRWASPASIPAASGQ